MTRVLTTENASKAKTVRNIANPEWGVKKFNYNAQFLFVGRYAHTVGIGSNSSILDESEFKFWEVVELN